MDKNSDYFTWGGNWYIESGKAWFVDGQKDVLYCVDLELNECEYIVHIPNIEKNKFRLNQTCLKIDNDIYILPDIGRNIWIYNLQSMEFKKIPVENPNSLRLEIYKFWIYENKIYALSVGLKKIIEIDIIEQIISNYYVLYDSDDEQIDNNAGIRVEENIYCASSVLNRIYQFNLKSKQVTTHIIPVIKGGFQTISFDGRMFWLSGYRREIYIWDKENNSTKVLGDFPEDFGIYDFKGMSGNFLDCMTDEYEMGTFIVSEFVGKYIWFIPFQTNKVIYVDKETYQINVLEIDGEDESRESLSNNLLGHKYLVQYVRDNRYIGLFSLKNSYIVEIDTVEKNAAKRSYAYKEKDIGNLVCSFNGILNENSKFDKMIFTRWITANNNVMLKNKVTDNAKVSVGNSIYSEMEF